MTDKTFLVKITALIKTSGHVTTSSFASGIRINSNHVISEPNITSLKVEEVAKDE